MSRAKTEELELERRRKISINTKKALNKPEIKMKMKGENHPMYGKENKWGNHTKSTKEKISNSHKGKKHTEATKEKISKAHLGKKLSKEHRENISKAKTEKNNPMYGKKQSKAWVEKRIKTMKKPEVRKKMSDPNKGTLEERHGNKKAKEIRKKMSKLKTGKNHPMYGRKNKWGRHTLETKQKIKIARAKQIVPKFDTSIEIKIQNFLKQLNIDFFTHQYIKEIEHGYQCDILIPSKNLVIECDGNYFHNYPIGKEIDHIRTKELLEKGFKVLRLWEFEIRKMTIKDFERRLDC